MSDRRTAPHPLSVLHLLAMLGLLGWWSWYYWQHCPARAPLRRPVATHAPRQHAGPIDLRAGAGAQLADRTGQVAEALRAAAVDVSAGLVVLVLFGFATGVYVRKFEIWLQARGSGAAMTLAGTGLSDKALAANTGRGGPTR